VSNSVFAEAMGFFHKGAGGKGTAPGDVCLTPPTPPAGPLPVPYVNMLSSSDLTKGSKTVKIQGNPTALESASEVSTSTGNEAGTQGGGLVTHKTKGKGSFTLWSFVVKAEGKGVGRHGDPMIQNTASKPPNCVCPTALENFEKVLAEANIPKKRCKEKYKRKKHGPKEDPSEEQEKEVDGKPCWECARDTGATEAVYSMRMVDGKAVPRKKNEAVKLDRQKKGGKVAMTHDHQPPLSVAWEMGGCHLGLAKFKELFAKAEYVKPHCKAHSGSQGPTVGRFKNNLRKAAPAK
jgi:hypothetical protein